jgi:hypothetical protein
MSERKMSQMFYNKVYFIVYNKYIKNKKLIIWVQ